MSLRTLIMGLAFSGLFLACSRSLPLDDVLGMAGDNKSELENVLEHYKEDSQKQRYARFLIANMPGHTSFEGEAVDAYRKMVDTVLGTVRIADINKEWERVSQ